MEQLRRLLQAVDDFQQRHRWLAFPVAVVKKYGEDQAGQRAALLAYYGFFSLFPLLLVAVTVLSLVLQGRSDLSERVVDSTLAQFPVIGDQIRDEVEGSRLRASGLALVVGAALALWGGLGVAEAAQAAMNGIWNVPRRRYPSFLCAACAGWPGWSSSAAGCCWPAWSRGSRPPPTPPGRGRPGWPPRPWSTCCCSYSGSGC
jgi:membrane protein